MLLLNFIFTDMYPEQFLPAVYGKYTFDFDIQAFYVIPLLLLQVLNGSIVNTNSSLTQHLFDSYATITSLLHFAYSANNVPTPGSSGELSLILTQSDKVLCEHYLQMLTTLLTDEECTVSRFISVFFWSHCGHFNNHFFH
jgi:hypothetical protein